MGMILRQVVEPLAKVFDRQVFEVDLTPFDQCIGESRTSTNLDSKGKAAPMSSDTSALLLLSDSIASLRV